MARRRPAPVAIAITPEQRARMFDIYNHDQEWHYHDEGIADDERESHAHRKAIQGVAEYLGCSFEDAAETFSVNG